MTKPLAVAMTRLSGHFRNFPDFSGWDEADWQLAIEERAAILEYDEGLPRAEAEALAAEQITDQRRRRRLQ